MTTQQKPRTAVIGCGAIGTRHVAAIRQSEHATLVAVCDVDVERARRLTSGTDIHAYASLDDLFATESLDAVTVATSDDQHVEPVIQAVEAGCHVFCEKLMATSLDDAKKMVEAATKHERHLAIDYNRRFGFGYQKAHELIKAGRIGDIRYGMIRVTDGFPLSAKVAKPYTILTALLSHHIDLLRFLCGEIVSVHSFFAPQQEPGVVHDLTLSFQFDNGAVGSIVSGWRQAPQRTWELTEVGGRKGIISVEDVMLGVKLWTNPDESKTFRPSYWTENITFYDSLVSHIHSFLAQIAAGEAPLVTGQDGLRGLEIIDAAIESERTRSAVMLSSSM
ncbi:Gfo/Idh/MocA family oxidoreductase [Chloroflexi bacterium TSY]|nr:Gfo/Idh/MocA family oxidoreductase [Chloroflexi bacterium TSY]